MPLYARRKDDRVLCGARGCGKELARIRLYGGPCERVVFEPGWQPRSSDGVMEMTQRAQKLGALNRRLEAAKVQTVPVDRHAQPQRLFGRVVDGIKIPTGEAQVEPWALPVDCVCPMPKCGNRQTLDPRQLQLLPDGAPQVAPEPESGRTALDVMFRSHNRSTADS